MNEQKRKSLKRIVLILVSWGLLGNAAAQEPVMGGRVVVIEGATLIDGTGTTPLPNSVIVIEGSKIQVVGAKGTVSYPPSAEVVHAEGRYIIPGLIESHAHYPGWSGELFLAYGVTSVTDVGNSTEWIMAMKQVFELGEVKMPRLFSTGEFLTAPISVSRGFRGEGNTGPYRTPVADVQEARETTRRIIRQGMDGIKVWQNLLPEQLRAIIEEAHQANIPVMGHAYDAEEAGKLGFDRIEHTHGLLNATIQKPENRRLLENGLRFSASLLETERFDRLAKLLASKGVYYDPLLLFEYKAVTKRSKAFAQEARQLLEHPALRYIPEDARLAILGQYRTGRETGLAEGFMGPLDGMPPGKFAEHEEGYRKDQEFVRRFVAAGGRLCAGTDTASLPPGLSLHQELQMLVDAGISSMDALLAATRNPAGLLRNLDQLGTLEPGKLADLVILRANPLNDIANTQQIEQVMLDGEFVDTSFHPDYGVPFARPVPYPQGQFRVPTVTKLSPGFATEGDGEVQLEVRGRNLNYASQVIFGEEDVPTTFTRLGRLTASIPAKLLRRPGTFFVRVRNPRPGGGVSNGYGFVVLYKNETK